GEPAVLPIHLHNHKRFFPSIAVAAELRGDLNGKPAVLRAFFPLVHAGAAGVQHFTWTPPGRGWYQLKDVRFLSRYPFGLLLKSWTAAVETDEKENFYDPENGFF